MQCIPSRYLYSFGVHSVLLAAWLVAAPAPVHDVELKELGLALALPAISDLSEDLGTVGNEREERRGLWRGFFGSSRVRIELLLLGGGRFDEPEEVAAFAESAMREDQRGAPERTLLPGRYGWAEIAVLLDAPLQDEQQALVGRQWILCGLLQQSGYVIRIDCRPAPDEQGAAAMRDFLVKGVRYDGAVRGPFSVDVWSGSIRLSIDPDSVFFIDAESSHGSVRSDLSMRSKPSAPPADAPTVRLRTRSGSIVIEPR